MFVLQCEDIANTGPDGQTQDWPIARFDSPDDAGLACTRLRNTFKGVFYFRYYEEDQVEIPINPNTLWLINDLRRQLNETREASK